MARPDQPNRRVPAEDLLRRQVDRRVFLEWTARAGMIGVTTLGGVTALAACGGDDDGDSGGGGTQPDDGTSGSTVKLPSSLKVGVITPQTGLASFVGGIVDRSLRAAQAHIEAENLFPGTTVSYEIVDAKAEDLADATGKAYAKLAADPDVIGILWCTPIGLKEARARIQRDSMPVIAVFYDAFGEGWLYPDGPEQSIFQSYLPDAMAMDALLRYAKEDRGYDSAGLIFDATIGDAYKKAFEKAIDKNGLRVAGIEEFNLFTGDYGAQIQRLKGEAGQCLFVWGLSDNTAGIIRGLADIGADYVDTPAAKGSSWRPQVLGSPGGTGDKKWAELAKDAAKVGTLTAWKMEGLFGTPSIPILQWMKKYLDQLPTGGEEAPANGYWSLLEAVRQAGSTDRRKMVTALEDLTTAFAGLEYSFTSDRHLSVVEDHLVLLTLERYDGPPETDPPYVLGVEFETERGVFPEEHVGPAHLVRPTLEANRRAFPEQVKEIVTEGWGTQCTKKPPDALGEDVEMTNDCKIH